MNLKSSKYLLILSVTILIFIGIELLLPQPKHQHVYQDYDLKDYMTKSFEYKPNDLILYKADALSFLYKNEGLKITKNNIEEAIEEN